MAKFDRHFAGRDNAGLRAKIRDAVEAHRCGESNAASVLSLAGTVALTAGGRATLERVVEDYRAAGDNTRCDCDACYAGKLQSLGALG